MGFGGASATAPTAIPAAVPAPQMSSSSVTAAGANQANTAATNNGAGLAGTILTSPMGAPTGNTAKTSLLGG